MTKFGIPRSTTMPDSEFDYVGELIEAVLREEEVANAGRAVEVGELAGRVVARIPKSMRDRVLRVLLESYLTDAVLSVEDDDA